MEREKKTKWVQQKLYNVVPSLWAGVELPFLRGLFLSLWEKCRREGYNYSSYYHGIYDIIYQSSTCFGSRDRMSCISSLPFFMGEVRKKYHFNIIVQNVVTYDIYFVNCTLRGNSLVSKCFSSPTHSISHVHVCLSAK